MGREDEIRLIAYNIWEEEGCFEGRDCEHWLKAETIWKQQHKPGVVAKIAKAGPEQVVKKQSKIVSGRKKSPKS